MNEEELLREARIRSVAEPEELTFGELAGELELGAERERRFLQALALVAYRHAVLTARALAGQSLPPVGEAFPFWTEEELLAARADRGYLSVVVCFAAFLANDLYGFINWRRMEKMQTQACQKSA